MLKERDLIYEREKEILIPFGQERISGNKVDFFVENKILIDVKSKKYITREDYLQMQRYLKAADLKLGLIVNFRSQSVTIKRVINPEAQE